MRHLSFLAACLAGALVAGTAPVRADVLITVDKSAQRMSVSVDGRPVYTWPVSTGRDGYATPTGTFTPSRLDKDHISKEWDDAPMPYAIFFTNEGHAIHGSYATRQLGNPASHGCIRLAPSKAAKLFDLVKTEGLQHTRIVVTGDDTVVAGRKSSRSRLAKNRYAPEGEFDGAASGDPYGLDPNAALGVQAQTSYRSGGYAVRRGPLYPNEAPVYGYGRPIDTSTIYGW